MIGRWLTGVALLVSVAVGCTAEPSPGTTAVTSTTPQTTDVDSEWSALGITDYRIIYEMRHFNGMGGAAADGRYTVVVKEGGVVECDHEPWLILGYDGCRTHIVPSVPEMTNPPIDYLFDMIKGRGSDFTTVEYDDHYRIPMCVEIDDPAYADDEALIVVIEFEPTGT